LTRIGSYSRHSVVREKPSVLTKYPCSHSFQKEYPSFFSSSLSLVLFLTENSTDRAKLEFRKKVREGKTLDQYNAAIAEFINREDSYEALVTLMDMYATNTTPDVETFNILVSTLFSFHIKNEV
jgi:hypothetical protein